MGVEIIQPVLTPELLTILADIEGRTEGTPASTASSVLRA